jgi:hypothetical protein
VSHIKMGVRVGVCGIKLRVRDTRARLCLCPSARPTSCASFRGVWVRVRVWVKAHIGLGQIR